MQGEERDKGTMSFSELQKVGWGRFGPDAGGPGGELKKKDFRSEAETKRCGGGMVGKHEKDVKGRRGGVRY